jgi:hypothetical protein
MIMVNSHLYKKHELVSFSDTKSERIFEVKRIGEDGNLLVIDPESRERVSLVHGQWKWLRDSA